MSYENPSQSIEVVEGESVEVVFKRSAETVSTEYLAWLAQYFNEQELTEAWLVGESADPDQDGHLNDFEFIAQLSDLL